MIRSAFGQSERFWFCSCQRNSRLKILGNLTLTTTEIVSTWVLENYTALLHRFYQSSLLFHANFVKWPRLLLEFMDSERRLLHYKVLVYLIATRSRQIKSSFWRLLQINVLSPNRFTLELVGDNPFTIFFPSALFFHSLLIRCPERFILNYLVLFEAQIT